MITSNKTSTATSTPLTRKVTIRGEEHTVIQAVDRSLTRTAYHVGQITFLARQLTTDDWKWITIASKSSEAFEAMGAKYLK